MAGVIGVAFFKPTTRFERGRFLADFVAKVVGVLRGE